MSDTVELVKSIVTGLLAGGTAAGTTFFGTQADLKKRVSDMEKRLGVETDPRTGMSLALYTVEELVRRLRKDFDAFEDAPPTWVSKLLTRSRTQSGLNLEVVEELENKIRTVAERTKRVEDGLDDDYVSRADYDTDMKERAKEIIRLREEIIAVNAMLRGVMAALDIPQPRLPPRP
jgi:hypothetical protein